MQFAHPCVIQTSNAIPPPTPPPTSKKRGKILIPKQNAEILTAIEGLRLCHIGIAPTTNLKPAVQIKKNAS